MMRHLHHFVREVRDVSVETFDIAYDTLAGFGRELLELGESPDRTRQGLVAACSVMLATYLALLLEIQSPWWAAISAFMSLTATGGGSLRRGLLRMAGTAAGALLGFIMARWLPYDHFAMYLFIAGVTMLGVVAMQVSPHGLAWMFLSITSILVLLEAINNPLQAASIAYYRMFEVGIGVLSAIIVANILQDWHREPPPTAPGWRHLLGAQWPVVLHGARSAIAVVAVMSIWMALEISQVVEMAITVAVVMAAPVVADGGLGTRHAVAIRSLHRLLGCLLGGAVALACLALNVESFVWWLGMIGVAVWIGMHIQIGPHGVGYVGTQAAFAFIVTLIQGEAPPDSILPGVDRFAGIVGGLAILMVVSMVLWPSDEEIAEQKAAGRE
ncbi:Fusaric acid resistance protein family protein [Rhodospirillales bacterium URHD0017]|nr:Fusaric acid resistance protein family protein [Rhodospirillales bacterium URHD0017]